MSGIVEGRARREATLPTISSEEARAIARDACIFGFPLVDSYRIQHAYFVDRGSSEFKIGWNRIFNNARLYTPDDRAVQTPNSDTPYSYIGADLRAEPLVITLPPVDSKRYVSVQFIDAYTFNFAYAGTRTTGNGGGTFLLAGPGWKGETPRGVNAVIRSETEFAFVLFRTQLFDTDDLENVRNIQAGYVVQTLSGFRNAPAPLAPVVEFLKPISAEDERTSLEFFKILNFVLRFCPTHPTEQALMNRFAALGIGGDRLFDSGALTPEIRRAIQEGMADAWQSYADFKSRIETGRVPSGDIFGTRQHLRNNYVNRMGAAVDGIYGNSQEEAVYAGQLVDDAREKLDASAHRYTMRFAPGQLPPANAFWSLTLYELPSRLLSANPLNRYLINSPMLSGLKRDADGGLTIHVQHESPGAALESNWLPAPAGAFFTTLRLYWPKQEALNGTWKPPILKRVEPLAPTGT